MKLTNHKITLYEGTIKRLYAEGFTLNKEITPIVKREVVKKELFRKSIFDFVEINSNRVLPTEEEALDYMNSVVQARKNSIYEILANPNVTPEEKENFLKELKVDSSCCYLDAPNSILKPVKEVSRQELKQLTKKRK